jgi:hypothetical protein
LADHENVARPGILAANAQQEPGIADTMCRVMMGFMDRVFDDKRVAVSVLMAWLCIVMILFKDIGLLDTSFMSFGPSTTAKFMGAVLDTWYKWGMVAIFTLVNTSVNDFMSDAISPWLLNTITDHKSKYIPYPKYICLGISQLWSVYCNLMSVFGMFLAMTQIDFVLIRMMADLTVNTYTNLKFMRFKEYSPSKYNDIEMQNIKPSSSQCSGDPNRVTDTSQLFCIEEDDGPNSPR